MKNFLSRALLALLMLAGVCRLGHSAQIELALNLVYNNPADANSGGQWQVIAASDEFGIENIAFGLTGINPTIAREAPLGVVNGGDGAGFSFFTSASTSSSTSIILGHGAPPSMGAEVGEFYGFGTLTNGSPDLVGAEPPGVNVVPGGPVITSLTGTSGIPWATGDLFGDAAFDHFGTLVSGTFAAGATPDFFVDNANTQGTVFTSLGTATSFGGTSLAAETTIVLLDTRSNLQTLADYNQDTLVNAADYTVFRDTVGAIVPAGAGADGNGNGVIDMPDYDAWRSDFGDAATPVVAGLVVVPEPLSAGLVLAALAGWLAAATRPALARKLRPN